MTTVSIRTMRAAIVLSTIATATAASPAAAGSLAVTPPWYDFGTPVVGTWATASVTLKNTGFRPLSYWVSACPGTPLMIQQVIYDLAPGESRVDTMSFKFTQVGNVPPYCVEFHASDSYSPQRVPFIGTVVAAPAPTISVTPSAYDFGTVVLGSVATASVTVANAGSATLSYSLAACPGTPFTFSPVVYDLAPGAARDHPFSFMPSELGSIPPYCVELRSNDAARSPLQVPFVGTVVPAPAPPLSVSPPVYDFGTVVAGTLATASVTVTNVGSAGLWYSVAACPGTPWALPAIAYDLAPGASRAHPFSFTPFDVGELPPYCLEFRSGGGAVSVPFVGTVIPATAPVVRVSPPVLDFGTVVAGSLATASVSVANVGDATLTYEVASCPGTPVALPAVTYELVPGASREHPIGFTPEVVGSVPPYCVEVASNDPAQPVVPVPFAGSVVAAPAPAVSVSPPAYDFGTVVLGAEATASVTVRNAGDATLWYSLSSCPGTPWALPALAYDLAPGASRAHPFSFTPTEVGSLPPYCIELSSNDPAQGTVVVPFVGTVIAPPRISVIPPVYDFGTVVLGTDATASVTVANTGGVTLTYAMSSCPGTPFVFPAVTYDLLPGASRDHPFSFRPAEAGSLPPWCVQLDSNDADHSPFVVPFAGTVVAPAIAAGPPALAFVGVKRGTTASLAVTVANVGTADLVVGGASLCPGTSPEFSVAGGPFTVAPGASRDVVVTYSPADATADAGCVTITSNDARNGSVTIALSGAKK